LIDIYDKHGAPTIAVRKIPLKLAHLYGIVKGINLSPRLYKIEDIVEKPKMPLSDIAVVTRYIITPEIFGILENTKPAVFGEIWLTDALRKLLKHRDIYAYEIEGDLYDSGSKAGYLQANFAFAFKNNELKKELRKFIKNLKQF
jgi:UTP--glucose-1-phosphate uridylyltransferase